MVLHLGLCRIGERTGFVEDDGIGAGQGFNYGGVFQVKLVAAQHPQRGPEGEGRSQRQGAGAGDNQHRGEGPPHGGRVARPPVSQRAHGQQQRDGHEIAAHAVGVAFQRLVGFFFGEGGVIPELGEVALRYFAHHFQLDGLAKLSAAGVHQLARGAGHRRALTRHEGVVNLPRAAQQHGIGRNHFLVPHPNTVAFF